MTPQRSGVRIAVAGLIVLGVAAHAVLLFRVSKRLVVPAAATAIALVLATHLGAGRWLIRRVRSARGDR